MTTFRSSSSQVTTHRSLAWTWVPILLYPRVLSIKNALFKHRSRSHPERLSWGITLLMMWGLYSITMQGLHGWSRLSGAEAIPLSILLGALFTGLCAMIFLSSCVSAISSLYMSKDIELILSSPITTNALLAGKVIEVGFASSWMLGTFAIPLYISFGHFFHAGPLYYALAPIVGMSILTLTTLLGALAAILVAAMLPARRGRNICVAFFVTILGVIFCGIQSGYVLAILRDTQAYIASHPILAFLRPFHSTGRAIEALLNNNIGATSIVVSANVASGLVVWIALKAAFSRFFRETYSQIHSNTSRFHMQGRFGPTWSRLLFPRTTASIRALITKDFYSFSRDLTHTVQLCMLLAICVLYLYNFRRIDPPTHVSPETLRAWDVLMILTNLSLGSMVVLSICSRFIFPAVSLEGHSFWIVQASPLSMKDFLRAKYSSWILPTMIISAIIFSSGSLAIGLEPLVALTTTICGVIMTHGLVALAVGLGARSARFDWEHVTQLTTSSANLWYMLAGLVLVAGNLTPISVMYGAYMLFPSRFGDAQALGALFGSGLAIVIAINFIVGRYALCLGARKLGALS